MSLKNKIIDQCTLLQKYYHFRIPFSALGRKRGSMTVEAALVLPIFLFAMLLFSFLGILIRNQDEVQWALTRVAREASVEYGASESEMMKNTLYYQTKLRAYLGTKVPSAHLLESRLMRENDEIDLIVNYQMELPFRVIKIGRCHFRQRVHTRAFTGVEHRGDAGGGTDCIVYVTPTGRVYHKNKNCTYLRLSVSQVKFEDLESLRNGGGGIYKSCERCARDTEVPRTAKVWITNFGDRYHTSRSCSGIKRNIEEISLSEAGGRIPCSKCGEYDGG